MSRLRTTLVLATAAFLAACSGDGEPVAPETVPGLDAARGGKSVPAVNDPALEASIETALRSLGASLEAEVRAHRPDVAALGAYWTGHPDAETVGTMVFFNDRGNKQLEVQWVPFDPRRLGRDDIGYAVFPAFGDPAPAGLTAAQVEAAIDRAMATWDAQKCSNGLAIPKGTFQEWLDFESDILHGGFAALGPGVLGSTFPFIFVDPVTGVPTDIDGDGNLDYAFAIILYSSDFTWAIDADIDVETVALHEAGHGLAQAHFGKAFVTLANGKLHFAPRALMNAAYSGVQQSLTGTDGAGHCSMYGSWPNN